jgi:hypothetical protein
MEIEGDGCENYPELMSAQYIPESKHHIVPHKYGKTFCVNQNFKIF